VQVWQFFTLLASNYLVSDTIHGRYDDKKPRRIRGRAKAYPQDHAGS